MDEELILAEDRVYYMDASGRARSLPARWTSVLAADPAVVMGGGRAHFLWWRIYWNWWNGCAGPTP